MNKAILLAELTQSLDQLYPPKLAEEWDKVGLHFGHLQRPIHKVMTALDIRPEVVQEAIDRGIDTIIVHHPVLFRGIERFDLAEANIQMYEQIILNQINIFVLHTNLDKAWNGMNDWLAEALNLQNIREISPCELADQPTLGRMGDLPRPLPYEALITHIQASYDLQHLKLIAAKPQTSYQTIAIIGGSGSDYLSSAQAQGAEVFITGDVSYHTGHDALDMKILLVDVGHHVEALFIPKMAEILKQMQEENQWDIEIYQSELSTNPFQYI